MKLLCLLALCSTALAALKEVQVDQNVFNERAGHSVAGGSELKLVKEVTLANGVVKQKFMQFVNGVPVENTGVVATKTDHGPEDAQGIMYEIDAESQGVMSIVPISKEEALDFAKKQFLKDNKLEEVEVENPEIKLTIDPTHGKVYMVDFLVTTGAKPTRPFYLVAVADGAVVDQWEGLDTTNGGGPGGNTRTGKYTYGAGTTLGPLDVKKVGNTCYLENANVKTVNLNHAKSKPGNPPHAFTCPNNYHKQVNGAYSPLNDAHYFGNLVFKLFNAWAGVPPLNFQLVLRVHYSYNFENAFWDGRVMTYGDGASRFYPLIDINVVCHEAAHGFTGQNSGLVYRGMSGGMNEAYSDIAGESAEAYTRKKVDWMVGADIFKRRGSAMRYFQRPENDGRSIGHASKYYNGMDVHFSSGVYNRAYYLMMQSGEFTYQQAFAMFTLANRLYWTAQSTFNQGACGVEKAAKDLNLCVSAVTRAFSTVGVSCGRGNSGGSCKGGSGGGGGGTVPPPTTCKNYNAGCDHWKRYCFVQKYASFMKKNCPKTCGYCKVTG